MRASASLSFDDGISTSSWNAVFAFRRRVSMSAIGSVIMSAPTSSPGRLGHARYLAGMDHGAEADPAETEALVHGARAAAAAAPRVGAHLELRRALLLLDESLLGHVFVTPSSARRGGTGNRGRARARDPGRRRSEEHTSELQSLAYLV